MALNPDKLWKDAQRAQARAEWPSAIKTLNLLVKLKPNVVQYRHLLGLCQRHAGQQEAAWASLQAALALTPPGAATAPGLLLDAGLLARESNRPDSALALLETASQAGGRVGYDAATEQARLLMALGRRAEAAGILQALLGQAGLTGREKAEPAVLLALLSLADGQFAEGWRLYAQRFLAPATMAGLARHDFGLPPVTTQGPATQLPANEGPSPETGKTWVWPEQGIGDEILFASVLTDAGKAGWRIKLGCYRRNLSLFRRSFPDLDIIGVDTLRPGDLADCDSQLPLADLVARLRPGLEAFPAPAAYLRPDAAAAVAIRSRYDAAWPGKQRIGISWRSSSAGPKQKKAVELAALARALAAPDRVLIDLQYGDTAAERAALQRDHGIALHRDPAIDPLGETDPVAAQMAALDAVVTISNTAAHIAGAIGAPGLVLLPADDGLLWYWQRGGDRTLWYPRLHLLRQPQPGDWSPLLTALPEKLRALIA